MATFLSTSHMTLAQALEYQRWDGSLSFVRELEKKSRLMQMIPWYPTSDGAVHKGAKATALPEGKFGAINKAVPTGYGATTEYTETVGVYELASFVDTRILEGRSTDEANRIREANDRLQLMGFLQGLAKEVITNPGTDADAVKGLLARRGSLDDSRVISMGGSGADLGSILFIRFGEDGVNLRYPSAGAPNLSIQDLGTVQALQKDSAGKIVGSFPAKETLARCYYGVDIADDDAFVRVCNVPTKTALSTANVQLLVDVINSTLDNVGQGYVAFAPKQIIAQFWKYLLDKNNVYFSQREVEGMGRPVELFGVPFFYEEFMTANEAQLTASA